MDNGIRDDLRSGPGGTLYSWLTESTTFPLLNTITVTGLIGNACDITAWSLRLTQISWITVGRIWWINHKARKLLGRRLQAKYRTVITLL
jgi:hypothetical protein